MGPMQQIVSGVLFNLEGAKLYVNWRIYALGMFGGVLTTLLAAILPAVQASRERAGRRDSPTAEGDVGRATREQAMASFLLISFGASMIVCRSALPHRYGTFGGMTS